MGCQLMPVLGESRENINKIFRELPPDSSPKTP